MRTLAVALILVLAGCGGGSDGKPPPAKTSAPPSAVPTKPTVAAPSGTPMPEALSRFRCEKDAKDSWRASGYVANTGKSKVTFQVTVYIGEAAGGTEDAKTRQVPGVVGSGSARFTIDKIPAPAEGGACHVQVLVTH